MAPRQKSTTLEPVSQNDFQSLLQKQLCMAVRLTLVTILEEKSQRPDRGFALPAYNWSARLPKWSLHARSGDNSRSDRRPVCTAYAQWTSDTAL